MRLWLRVVQISRKLAGRAMEADLLTIGMLIIGALGTGGIGYMFKAWSDNRTKAKSDSETTLLAFSGQSIGRIESLERQVQAEREHCDSKLMEQRTQFEAKLNYELHKTRNASDREAKLLWTLKIAPEKVSEAIPDIERMKERHEHLEMLERVGLAALGIKIDHPENAESGGRT
jgi:hypothetical protein